ncbi:MAG: transporter [Deltaproteobacteria bacterium]|nr:transporter [Deltaproteobacteria bacterium]
MKKAMFKLSYLAVSSALTLGANAFAEEMTTEATKFHAAVGEGQTLPRNVGRFRLVNSAVTTSRGYDKDGKEVKGDKKSTVFGTAVVAEYGLLDPLSLQVVAPIFFNNSMKDKEANKTYKGQTGLGDIEVGALYNLFKNDTVTASTGLGVRFPTGKNEFKTAEEAQALVRTGSGYYDLGLRFNVDLEPVNGVVLSWQDQEEWGLNKAKMTLPKELGGAKVTSEKTNLSRKGFVQAAFGLGAATDVLKAFVVKGRYSYDYDSAVKATIETQDLGLTTTLENRKDSGLVHKYGVGASVDGRGYNLPLALDVDYDRPFAGRDAEYVSDTFTVALKSYVRF